MRTKPFDPLPPPIVEFRRDRLVAAETCSPARSTSLLTVFCVLMIVWLGPPLLKFLIVDAVWDGASRADCIATPAAPRGRRLLGVRDRAARLLHLRVLSDRRALAGRCVLRAARVRDRLDRPGSTRRAAISAWSIFSLSCRCFRSSCWWACRCSGLPYVQHRAVGRHPGDHRGRVGRHRGVAAARHPACAGPALDHADRADGFRHLHRVRARRAADHRAVHGERDAAAVRARTPGRRTSCCAP